MWEKAPITPSLLKLIWVTLPKIMADVALKLAWYRPHINVRPRNQNLFLRLISLVNSLLKSTRFPSEEIPQIQARLDLLGITAKIFINLPLRNKRQQKILFTGKSIWLRTYSNLAMTVSHFTSTRSNIPSSEEEHIVHKWPYIHIAIQNMSGRMY